MSLRLRFALFTLGMTMLPLLLLGWFRLSSFPGALERAGVSEDIVGDVTNILTTDLLALIFVLAIASVLLTILATHAFVEPVNLLAQAMREFRNHRESPRKIPIMGRGEIMELTQAFNDMATQLADYIEELKEADEQKSQFIAILAHELRNPMAPIMLSLELLNMQKFRNPEAHELVEVMDRQIMAMNSLLDQLLDVSRLEQGGQIELHRSLVSLRDAFARAEESAQPFLRERGSDLSVLLPGEEMWLDADPVRLNQILVNLLKNAAEHNEAGENIWMSARREGDDALISVRDEGRGIPKESQSDLFELFSRGEGKTTRQSPGGLGLGLYLVKTFTELHGGTVRVVSEGKEGSGAEFIIRLPIAEPQTHRQS